MKKAKQHSFTTEAALCTEFIAHATKSGDWIAYAETGNWDIVLVRKVDGFQIGIQAKLVLNPKVLDQALPDRYWDFATNGPDCRALLVPSGCAAGLARICDFLGLTVIRQHPPESRFFAHRFDPELPLPAGYAYSEYQNRHWHEWSPVERVKLPEIVPDVVAGSSAPVQLTDWKIRALKLCVLLETRPVSRSDFKALGLDASRWLNFWLKKTDAGYVETPSMPNFRAQHPVNYAEIKSDAANWMDALKLKSGVLL